MKHVANWSGLCEQQKCLLKVSQFSQFRYFQFGSSNIGCKDSDLSLVSTSCVVKVGVGEDWIPLHKNGRKRGCGFLAFAPDLSLTPPTRIVCPNGSYEITKRIVSEEGRINSTEKLQSLYALRDYVFKEREEPFQWNLSHSV